MSARQEINTLAVEDSTKTRIRNGFDEGLRLSPAEALFDIQAEGLTEYRAFFQLLKDIQGQWTVNNGILDFQRPQDAAAILAHAKTIDKNMEPARTLEQASATTTIKGMGSL